MKPEEITDKENRFTDIVDKHYLNRWLRHKVWLQYRMPPNLGKSEREYVRLEWLSRIREELSGLIVNKLKFEENSQDFYFESYVGSLFIFTEDELLDLVNEVKNENNR
jgi:hypothetical protein